MFYDVHIKMQQTEKKMQKNDEEAINVQEYFFKLEFIYIKRHNFYAFDAMHDNYVAEGVRNENLV